MGRGMNLDNWQTKRMLGVKITVGRNFVTMYHLGGKKPYSECNCAIVRYISVESQLGLVLMLGRIHGSYVVRVNELQAKSFKLER
jgi:hypothetical protein